MARQFGGGTRFGPGGPVAGQQFGPGGMGGAVADSLRDRIGENLRERVAEDMSERLASLIKERLETAQRERLGEAVRGALAEQIALGGASHRVGPQCRVAERDARGDPREHSDGGTALASSELPVSPASVGSPGRTGGAYSTRWGGADAVRVGCVRRSMQRCWLPWRA
jgi:hypothetical protein